MPITIKIEGIGNTKKNIYTNQNVAKQYKNKYKTKLS